MFFVNSTFSHRSDKDGEICLFDEIVNLVQDTMTDGTSIDKDDRVLCSAEVLENNVNDVCFALGIIWRLRQVDWLLEPGAFYLGLDHIGRKHDVDGSRTDKANSEGMVDLSSDFGRVGELGNFAGDLGAHVGEDVEITVSERVVEEHAVSLRNGRRAADNVNDWDMFRKGTGNAIDGRELSHSKRSDKSSHILDTSIAISSVS